MIRSSLSQVVLLVPLLALLGCGGGTSVEDQERFQLDRDATTAIGDTVRAEVESVAAAFGGEGGAQGIADSLQFAVENFESIDASALSEEDQAKVEQIKSLVSEMAANPPSRADAQEKVQQLQDLANQLPKGDAGGASE